MGRRRPDVGPAICSLVHENYLIFHQYNPASDRAEILRVWHEGSHA
jgi:plasmid stabilization system protein ParE